MPTKRQEYHEHYLQGCKDDLDRKICDLWATGIKDASIVKQLNINRGIVSRRRFQIIKRATVSFPSADERSRRILDVEAITKAIDHNSQKVCT